MNRQSILGWRLGGNSQRPLLAVLLTALALPACGGGDSGGDDNGTGGTSGSGGSGGGSSGSGGGKSVPLECTSSGGDGDMVSVPAGAFLMGCNASVDDECKPEEEPGREVTLNAFQIDKTEVTQNQYTACVEAGDCPEPMCDWDCDNMDLPASCITWADAKKFCAWAGKRLPTEAEWEKAARGSDGRKFPWGNEAPNCDRLNMDGCVGGPAPAGSHPSGASPYGALDMGGNMVEMVSDWYDARYYQSAPASNPKGPASGTTYSGRGGGWKSEATWHRTSQRDWYGQDVQGQSLGFRCAK